MKEGQSAVNCGEKIKNMKVKLNHSQSTEHLSSLSRYH